MKVRVALACGALAWALLLLAAGAGTTNHLTFNGYSPPSSNAGLARVC